MVRLELVASVIVSLGLWHASAAGVETQIEHEELPDRIRIIYDAPEGCPSRTGFVERVSLRVKIPWIADETELARHIQVTLAPADSGFKAHMEYVDSTLRQVVRTVDADTCEQAVSAIALVTALAIESQAVHPGPPNPRHATQARPEEPKEAQLSKSDRDDSKPRHSSRYSKFSAQPESPSNSREPLPWIQEAGVRLGAASGFSPGSALGASVFWGIGRQPLPLFRLALSWYDSQASSVEANAPSAHFSLFAAAPQICMAEQLSESLQFAVAGCAGVETGLYRVKGIAPESTDAAPAANTVVHSHALFWRSVLVTLPVRLDYREMFLELAPEIRIPMVSGRFQYLGPYRSVYEIPHVAVGLGFATGLTFP